MKTATPIDLLRMADSNKGMSPEDIEKRYQGKREKANSQQTVSSDPAPVRFISENQGFGLDMSKAKYK